MTCRLFHPRLLTRSLKTTTTAPETYKPVDIAYATYETTRSYVPDEAPAPLVVMHGLFGSKANWNSHCKAFHQKTIPQRKVISIDARNHGDSPHTTEHTYQHLVEDLRALLDKMGLKRAALLGHSMGGRTMMWFALKYPHMVDRLIVADISPISTSSNMRALPALFTIMRNVHLPRNVPMSTARVSADLQLARIISDKGLRSFLLTNLVQRDGGSFTWRLNITTLRDSFHKHIATFPDVGSRTFDGPVLFLGGAASDFIQKTDHPHIRKLFPNAEFTYLKGAGHWLHSEKPVEFVHTCTEFLNRRVALG